MSPNADYERLGAFYLGRPYDLAGGKPGEGLLLYDSKDLVTHAVCVGMTGSGKTGLCIGLLEEAAIDGVPAIAIDPKGDLGNLLLTFPELRGEDFAPWVNEDDARKKGLSRQEYASQQADLWKKGLASWGQDSERIRRLREAAEFTIYTPGSTAGVPVSILSSFAAPPPSLLQDSELLAERIQTTVTSLLGLVGIEADPIRSREHILLATILEAAWKEGRDLDLAALIRAVQAPPVSRIGVLDLEAFYPAKDRFEMAMTLNNLLAAPGFEVWMQGAPLDIGDFLYTPTGRPRVSIFSIAHLSDAERMFFVALLLNETLGWMRQQSGTTSLRALLYMDEIFGYLPPVANPPSKAPLLALLKQARAFGLGVVLATQNPVDLDYKALSNAGTWFLGRLQTERDKARVLEGLEGAAAGGGRFDRQEMERILAGLGKRVFLMNNVHEDAPTVFETRWVMSYLRGPLTREQIQVLMEPRRTAAPIASTAAVAAGSAATQRPVLPPQVPQCFVPLRQASMPGQSLLYRPRLLGSAEVHFADRKTKVETSERLTLLAALPQGAGHPTWAEASELDLDLSELETAASESGLYDELPAAASRASSYGRWEKDFADWLYRSRALELLTHPELGEVSRPGESERDFRVRLQQAAREGRDEAVEELRRSYASKITRLEERIRRAQEKVERESEQARQQKLQTAISVGATVMSALLGRKKVSLSSLGRATTAARGAGRAVKETQDVARAQESVEALQRQLEELDAEFRAETETLQQSLDPLTRELEKVIVKPRRKDISVELLGLAWAPYWRDAAGRTTPAWS